MKKLFTLYVFLFSISLANAQEVEVTTNKPELQIGFLGVWLNNEYRLSDQFALRAEIGLDMQAWGDLNYTSSYVFLPVITAEPRWYYNLAKRSNKGKTTKGNFGNFFSLKTSFHPDLFVISQYDDIVIPDLSIVPTWGIRRPLSTNFVFETGIGFGYIHYFYKSQGYSYDEGNFMVNLHLRFGYRF
ncbi:hypothetical protein [Algoriphagus aquimarinus]|uniref:DUF3575 domain-containing protein n=1 Tax=Algoriphagus aquimarinus TaxID=237018 RepID=A0A1I0WP17_9BACT|nr:hypothetical protein [Algoriphagus aquimarinus]SFA90499.1 hypothetical protein SAMN04489723_102243 [Algoriphagus aquimarinus]